MATVVEPVFLSRPWVRATLRKALNALSDVHLLNIKRHLQQGVKLTHNYVTEYYNGCALCPATMACTVDSADVVCKRWKKNGRQPNKAWIDVFHQLGEASGEDFQLALSNASSADVKHSIWSVLSSRKLHR